MDYIKNLDSCKYVMSLDTLDLSLLPKYSFGFSKSKAPLWTANNWKLSTTDYFEFEIKPKSETTTVDDESKSNNDSTNYQSDLNHLSGVSTPISIPTETIICHICDLDVPTAYIDDHENSLKHKAYLKIANVVLERTRKHMLKKSNRYLQKNNSTFFCGPCNSVVLAVDKANHEKSKAHKHSVSLDRVLYELVDLYTHEEHDYGEELSAVNSKSIDNESKTKVDVIVGNNENETKVDEMVGNNKNETKVNEKVGNNENETKVAEMVGNNGNETKVNEKVGNNENETKVNQMIGTNENETKVDEMVDNKVVISDIRALLEDLETKTIESYIKMIDEFNKDKEYVLSTIGNDIKICRDYCDIIVTADNFNGFIRVDTNSVLCIVCKVVLVEEKAHKYCDAHIKNIAVPFKNHHCTRNLNDVIHCVICNRTVDDADFHSMYNDTHRELLEKALLTKKNKEKKQTYVVDEVSTQCTNASAEKNPSILVKPKELNASVENQPSDLSNVAENKETEANKSDRNKFDGTVPNGVDNDSNSHRGRKDGNRLLKSISAAETKANPTAALIATTNDMYLCRACNIEMHVNNVRSHFYGSKHVFNSKSKLHYIMQVSGSADLLCRVCNVYTADDVNEIRAHVTTVDHVSRYKLMLHINYLTKERDNFYCEPCDTIVLKMNEFCHIEKVKHEINLAAFNTQRKVPGFCGVCQVVIPFYQHYVNIYNNGMRLHCQMEATDNEKTLTCKVCNVAIPNIDDSITEHVRGKKHESTLKGIIYTNDMICVEGGYFCNTCQHSVKTHNLFKHIYEVRHKVLTALEIEPVDRIDIEESEEETENSDTETDFKEDYDEARKHQFVGTDDKVWLQCKICYNTKVRNTKEAVERHIATKEHIDGYSNLISDNVLLELDEGGNFCAICDCLVPLKGKQHHAMGTRHIGNFNSAISKTHCDLCNLHPKDMLKHILSDEHVTAVIENQTLMYYCEYCKVLMLKSVDEEPPNIFDQFPVKDKLCLCTVRDLYQPDTSRSKFH